MSKTKNPDRETGFRERLRIEIRFTGCWWMDQGKCCRIGFTEEKENGFRQILKRKKKRLFEFLWYSPVRTEEISGFRVLKVGDYSYLVVNQR